MIGRWAVPALFAVLLAVTLVFYVTGAIAFHALDRAKGLEPLAQLAQTKPPAKLPDIHALASSPLDQGTVSNVITIRAYEEKNLNQTLRDTAILSQLGWRSTRALQNLLWRSALQRDIPTMMNVLDALLRREKLLGDIYPVLDLMTLDPELRQALVARLASKPSWRAYYLLSASSLKDDQKIMGRYALMRDIQRAGGHLTRNEIAPLLPRLIAQNHSEEAFKLWQVHLGTISRPLADPDFRRAARVLPSGSLPIPFEWQLANGVGFFADADTDQDGAFASIDWNGRGVPVFISQRTSATPGRYRLIVTGQAPMDSLAQRIGFQFVCDDGKTTAFKVEQAGAGPKMLLTSDTTVPCDFPTLQLFGLVQPATSTVPLILRNIRLVRAGG